MRRTVLVSALSAFVVLFATACGGDSSNSVTGTNNTGTGATGPMSATVNGASWVSAAPAVIYSNSIVSIAGIEISSGTTIAFASFVTGPGTYSLSAGSSTFGLANVTKGGQGWTTSATGGSGTLVLTTLTTTHVVGTFAFDAVAQSGGATGTMHVTNGKFDITFTP